MNVMERMTATRRREQILHISAEEFSRRGLHGTSVEAIARRASISQPYVFRLFGTKKELFIEVMDSSYDTTVRAFERAGEGLTDTAALASMGAAYLDLLQNR